MEIGAVRIYLRCCLSIGLMLSRVWLSLSSESHSFLCCIKYSVILVFDVSYHYVQTRNIHNSLVEVRQGMNSFETCKEQLQPRYFNPPPSSPTSSTRPWERFPWILLDWCLPFNKISFWWWMLTNTHGILSLFLVLEKRMMLWFHICCKCFYVLNFFCNLFGSWDTIREREAKSSSL